MSDAMTLRDKTCGYCRAVPAALACDDYREATPCLIRRLQSFIDQDIKNRDYFDAELRKANARADAAQALLTETRTKALEEAAAICDWEWAEYVANGKECDAAGNTFGGTVDNASALTCQVLAERIRSLKAEGGEK